VQPGALTLPALFGIAVARMAGMAEDSEPSTPAPDGPVHQFTVQRGMSVVLVIETTSWYSGLLQAALARITLEGEN
jgi:hypothetical protein